MDGDGSIHFQLVQQKEYRFGYYIRASLSFSQATIARHGLELIQAMVGAGYLRDRRYQGFDPESVRQNSCN